MKTVVDKMIEMKLIDSRIIGDGKEIPTDKVIELVKEYAKELQIEQIKACAYWGASYIKSNVRHLMSEEENPYVDIDCGFLMSATKVTMK